MIQQNHPRAQEPPMHAHITQARTHHAPTPTQTTTPPTRHTHTHTKMTQIHANCLNFVRISYEIRNNHIHGTYCGTKFVRNSHEFRTNFVRTSYEFRTIFAGHCTKSHTNTTYACTGVPTPTHISLYLPPRHPHTHTHTHTPHKHTHQGPLHCSLRDILTAQCQIDSG